MQNNKKSDLVSVNLLPVSILLAAIIISGTILYSQNTKANNTTNNNETDQTQDVEGTESQGFKDAKTTIDDDPYIGDKSTAKVAIIEFSEYQCSYCKRHTDETLPELIKEYVDEGKIIYVFRDFQMYGEVSEGIAKLGECINDKYDSDKFLEYHKGAFGLSTIDSAYDLITSMELDLGALKECANKDEYSDDLLKDMEDGKSVGITGTPGFVVGKLDKDGNVDGKLIAGAYPYSDFKTLIDSYLD